MGRTSSFYSGGKGGGFGLRVGFMINKKKRRIRRRRKRGWAGLLRVVVVVVGSSVWGNGELCDCGVSEWV